MRNQVNFILSEEKCFPNFVALNNFLPKQLQFLIYMATEDNTVEKKDNEVEQQQEQPDEVPRFLTVLFVLFYIIMYLFHLGKHNKVCTVSLYSMTSSAKIIQSSDEFK